VSSRDSVCYPGNESADSILRSGHAVPISQSVSWSISDATAHTIANFSDAESYSERNSCARTYAGWGDLRV